MRRIRSSYTLSSDDNKSHQHHRPGSFLKLATAQHRRNYHPPPMAGARNQQSSWNWNSIDPPSRSTTPRASWPLTSSTPAPDSGASARRNPWASAPHSPPSDSRSATPIAPQPVRPVLAPPPVPRTPFNITFPPSPVRSEYAGPSYPARNRDILGPAELSELVLTPSHISDLKLCFPSLLSKQGWDSPTAKLCYMWALKNPKTALLLYMTNNLENWPIAAIFTPLRDDMLPFSVGQAEAVVGSGAAPSLVAKQRAVCICTIEAGTHVLVKSWEDLPLQPIDTIQSSHQDKGLSEIDKVRWILDKEERLQVRKQIRCSRKAHRALLESELRQFRKLKHKGLAAVTASYAQEEAAGISTVGILMSPVASCDFAEYLQLPQGTIQTHLLKRWFIDLLEALSYLHGNDIQHKNIRPAKILVDGERILFATFGISLESTSFTETKNSNGNRNDDSNRYLSGERYIYAAPEALQHKKTGLSSDIFSLGCMFSEMSTIIKQQSIENFRTFRTTYGDNYRTTYGDSSFAANLAKATRWIDGLAVLQGGPVEEVRQDAKALTHIKTMIHEDPDRRPTARMLVDSFRNIWQPAVETNLYSRGYESQWSGPSTGSENGMGANYFGQAY